MTDSRDEVEEESRGTETQTEGIRGAKDWQRRVSEGKRNPAAWRGHEEKAIKQFVVTEAQGSSGNGYAADKT